MCILLDYNAILQDDTRFLQYQTRSIEFVCVCVFVQKMFRTRTSYLGIEPYSEVEWNDPLSSNILQFSNMYLAFECTVHTPTT